MITAQFILFFFAFLIICMFVMGALNRDLRDKRYLSTMGCLLSVMMIVYDGLNRLILQRQTSVVPELLFLCFD